MIRAAVLGGTGYGGMELLRYLLPHPEVDVVAVTSRTEEGPVARRWPHLAGFTDLAFSREDDEARRAIAEESDVLFFAKPHGVAAAEIPPLLETIDGVRAIDLSGDFRLRDASEYLAWYDLDHPHPDALASAVYGLPECGHRDAVREARLVANPGCHATAAILALWPAARAGRVAGRVSVVSVTGSSGSGSAPKPATHHPERFSDFSAYRPLRHQHLPEVVLALGTDHRVDFVPHSAPLARGIHVTAFVSVDGDAADLVPLYREAYAEEPFVRVLDEPPRVRSVAGTNLAHVGVTPGDGVACVTVAIDNLGKGMAGTAVQNMNLAFGLDERTGLHRPGAGL